ncbi:cytochrome P450 monooxygenase-like protein [Lophiostoma macrostomum CBS 122681]|uniref:Cytochrome P450 monooxygenase-like protein n=1 Tax=Lophiostoma macrostomum CBS 122681 TaxID=1314788 RepID=A0A6A6TS92_9PLEO|nr:cytochrome P450 monooxygenase-like protein [Lophiostoma macrostomum CBS 122681]
MASTATTMPFELHLSSPIGILASILVLTAIAVLYTAVYNAYFHPLSHIPGPFLARASPIPYALRIRSGNILPWVQKLHEQYGEVVRVAPTELSFISGETAWQDIYGFRIGKHKTGAYLKDRSWYSPAPNGVYSLISSDEATHSRMRRNLSHAFSDKALREQERLVQGLVDLLVQKLHEQLEEGGDVDLMRWYNYATFDIIADLTFGEPLYCLRDKDYHPWVNMVYASAKAIGLLAVRRRYRMFDYYDRFWNLFQDSTASITTRKEFFKRSSEKVTARLEKDADRPDFMSFITESQQKAEKAMTRDEIDSNAVLMLIAGSETTATLLTGVTYLLLKNPDAYAKLVREIRGRFKSQSEITIDEVNKLEYMIACLQEGLRYYPPVPTGFPRTVPKEGDRISGYYVPGGTSVYVSQHATNHSTRNYTDPDAYVPERWLGDEKYAGDRRETLNPFSFGPRNCLGKNLAYAEMRLIVAKVLFNFDIELVHKDLDWLKDQKLFTLWQKPSLMVRLRAVRN